MGMLKKIKNWLPTKRKLMQLYFALLFNANLKGFVSGKIYKGNSKVVCAPGINCYSCPGAVGACPLGSLQGAYQDRNALFYVGGILLLYCIVFGRMICGWLCPFGLVQELVYKIKTPKVGKSPVTRILYRFKYVLLGVFEVIIPVLYALRDMPLPPFCKYICPAGTLEGGVGLLSVASNEARYFPMLGPLFTWKFLLMVSTIVGCIFIFRLFCHFICPLGALYGLFNKLSIFGVKVDNSKCTQCGICKTKCKMDIRHVGDHECISCGECVSECPTQAIVWKGPRVLLKANEVITREEHQTAKKVTRIISGVLLIAILAGAITYYWTRPDPAGSVQDIQQQQLQQQLQQQQQQQQQQSPSGETVPVPGNQIGDLCYSYDLTLIDENGDTGVTENPAASGKITVINFWGTWCNPCVAELPHFEQIAQEYADTVKVYAVHSAGDSHTAPEFIAKNYPDSAIIFGRDIGADEDAFDGMYYLMLDGDGSYPYTFVLDEAGVIRMVRVGSVTHAELQSTIESILNP